MSLAPFRFAEARALRALHSEEQVKRYLKSGDYPDDTALHLPKASAGPEVLPQKKDYFFSPRFLPHPGREIAREVSGTSLFHLNPQRANPLLFDIRIFFLKNGLKHIRDISVRLTKVYRFFDMFFPETIDEKLDR